eukprot:CAMPEP_0197623796 /NCGR_PEP_ID=MMETSP1338-20131121/3721_1 /TAXON_ID=43686 ORGANISM="Pelagodinium beii, Strain RCC1491" /NCGR_SAMPLE_ID=MMETSP1338 /ASSEMBLY_ACC=CAM_ASM_000754 /LENGTH=552 /DNA_ID=CAMNT_0043193873 /DNA_START=78 /DNA_END=1736 /DNA_ORIENTATION=+
MASSEDESTSEASDHGRRKSDMSEFVKAKREKEEQAKKKAQDFEEKMTAKESGGKAAQLQRFLKVDPNTFTGPRLWLHKMMSHWSFDAAVGIVILANAATLGIETHIKKTVPLGCSEDCSDCSQQLDMSLQCYPVPEIVVLSDTVFLAIYTLEIILRLGVYGISVLNSNWIKFDAFLVVSSLVDFVLSNIEVDTVILEQLMVVRILRAAKLARALRLMVQFRTLWQLVAGLLNCFGVLAWTFILVMVLIACFAILGMEIIKVDPELPLDDPYNVAASDNFATIMDAMLTLLQLFSFDSIGGIYRPLLHHHKAIFFYFMIAMLLLSIALMNLVTAVMVNSSLDQASEDKDAKKAWEAALKAKQMEQLKIMFLELDEDGSGELSVDELDSAPEDARDQLKEIAGTDDLNELFELLDYDGGGTVGVEEFCDGVLKATSSSPGVMEMGRMIKQCTDILLNSRKSLEILEDPDKGFREFAKRVKKGGGGGGGGRAAACDDPGLDRIERKIGKMEKNLGQLRSDISRLIAMVDEKMMLRSATRSLNDSGFLLAHLHSP